jgi:hypothetical protein
MLEIISQLSGSEARKTDQFVTKILECYHIFLFIWTLKSYFIYSIGPLLFDSYCFIIIHLIFFSLFDAGS